MLWLFIGSLLALTGLFSFKVYEINSRQMMFGSTVRKKLDEMLDRVVASTSEKMSELYRRGSKNVVHFSNDIAETISGMLRRIARKLEK